MYSLQGFPDEGSDNMKIEKVNENQIRCTLTREDLAERQIKLSELAYGTEKAKMLFRDMMQQAAYEFGFEADDIPLMIEAIPLSADTIILVITKVEYPEELDTRFSRFSDPDIAVEFRFQILIRKICMKMLCQAVCRMQRQQALMIY